MLDFYESLSVMIKIISSMKGAFEELNEAHRPDNGMTITSLELCAYRYMLAELKVVKGEKSLYHYPPSGLHYIEDDSILGNSDKMLFYMKELAAAGEDDQATHNPYLLTKLNLKTVKNFSFDDYQKALIEQ